MADREEICDIIEPIKAYRWFAFNGKCLGSLNGYTWGTSMLAAGCYKPGGKYPPHRAPQTDCTCGIYSLKFQSQEFYRNIAGLRSHRRLTPDFEANPTFYIPGEVEIWGDVVRHVDGYRSEYCKVLRVFVPMGCFADMVHVLAPHDLLERSRFFWFARECQRVFTSLDIDFCVFDRVHYCVWTGGNWREVDVGWIREEGVPAAIHCPLPESFRWPSLFDSSQSIENVIRVAEESVARVFVPFHSIDFSGSDLIVNYETEADYATRQGNRQGESRGAGERYEEFRASERGIALLG